MQVLGLGVLISTLLIVRNEWSWLEQMVTSNRFANSLFNFALFYLIVITTAGCLKLVYQLTRSRKGSGRNNIYYGINNMTRVLIGMGGVVTAFSLFGIDPRTLLTSLSIVAAAVAIISKDFIYDFLIGLHFSFSRDFEIGDYVKLGEYQGHIVEIEILKIRLLNEDDDIVLIPNSKVYNGEIINYTKRDQALLSIDFQLDLSLLESLEDLEQDLVSSLQAFDEYIERDSFNLKIVEMKKDYIDFKFQYRLKELDAALQKMIRRRTVRQVFSSISSRRLKNNIS